MSKSESNICNCYGPATDRDSHNLYIGYRDQQYNLDLLCEDRCDWLPEHWVMVQLYHSFLAEQREKKKEKQAQSKFITSLSFSGFSTPVRYLYILLILVLVVYKEICYHHVMLCHLMT